MAGSVKINLSGFSHLFQAEMRHRLSVFGVALNRLLLRFVFVMRLLGFVVTRIDFDKTKNTTMRIACQKKTVLCMFFDNLNRLL